MREVEGEVLIEMKIMGVDRRRGVILGSHHRRHI